MHTIDYKSKIVETVYIVHDNSIIKSSVTQITLEVDPDGTGLIEHRTYHVHLLNTAYDIELRPEELVFESSDLAVDYMFDDTKVSEPSLTPYTIDYDYTPLDVVWSFDNQTP